MTKQSEDSQDSISVRALRSSGNLKYAEELAAIESAEKAADKQGGKRSTSLVQRLIYGPQPDSYEMRPTPSDPKSRIHKEQIIDAAKDCLSRGQAFTADGKLSSELRSAVNEYNVYGYTIPQEFGGAGSSYRELAELEEDIAANGLGGLAVEISGQLTIGAGGLIAYGSDEQKSLFLPLLAEGQLMAFALTEVKVGVNAKKVSTYVEFDEANDCWRLFATGDSNKLYITSAKHGGLIAVVARLGQDSRKLGLFITQLPENDSQKGLDNDFGFSCQPSGTEAFQTNINSRLSFDNFPIPESNRIDADGLEVLFYSLAMGRCMLSAMSAGFQRLYASEAVNYAKHRDGVGGRVINHELPQLSIGQILGGALQSRSLCHLSLQQNEQHINLSGLRDITKSAAAGSLLESLSCAERVIGGRSLNQDSPVSATRATAHAFSIVEGENDLIILGMVREITSNFVNTYMTGILTVLDEINVDSQGNPVSDDKRILSLGLKSLFKFPGRSLRAILKLLISKSLWALLAWMLKHAILDILALPKRILPVSWRPRYAKLPPALKAYARYAESRLQDQKWTYLGLNIFYQLRLTRAQIPLLIFGKRIEFLMSMLAVVYAGSVATEDIQAVAALQAELLKQKVKTKRVLRSLPAIEKLRRRLQRVSGFVKSDDCSMINDIEPHTIPHAWSDLKN
ncbi:MAG: acyl-CoA dehydrogenase [SAR86 cluster bacterium]|uniref:Acyl-CoA dehydrogenase n=1 Tax=SAR86 cluster bacterium TaxID=2030880 RepID=A0A2A5C8A0_9GAMM|nr:MAG: acyl-CoA dehydrogenase [SAR86 cluster bacterium]